MASTSKPPRPPSQKEDTSSATNRSGDESGSEETPEYELVSVEHVVEEKPRVTLVMGVDNQPVMKTEEVEVWTKEPDIVDVYAYLKRLCENYIKLMERKEKGAFVTGPIPMESEKAIWSAAVAANVIEMVNHIQTRMAEWVGDKTYAQLVEENRYLRAELERLKGEEDEGTGSTAADRSAD